MRFVWLVTMIWTTSVYASCGLPVQTVPFQDVTLNPGCAVTSNYTFSPYSMIVCFSNIMSPVGNIVWTYGGVPQSSTLPVSLITNNIYNGLPADSVGQLTITNNQSSAILVACYFGF